MQQSKQEYAKKEKEKRLVLCAGFGQKGFTPAVRRNANNFAKSRFFRRIGRAGPCDRSCRRRSRFPGSAAIVAAAPVIESDEEDIAISIAAVNLLGVVAMLIFPVLVTLLMLSPETYGEWCGLAIHATPQVIAAGFAHPTGVQTAGKIAAIVKLTRISLLGPELFILGVVYARQRRKQAVYVGQRVNYARLIPAFVIFFLALAFLRTTGFLPEVTVHMTDRFLLGGGDRTFHLGLLLASAGKWLITGAMAAVGLITEFRALKTGGVRPFALGLASTGIIAVLGLAYASL